MRLDQHLVEQGLIESRARAQAAIRAGRVRVDGEIARKPAQPVRPDSAVTVDRDIYYGLVSRGGVKLEAALEAMEIDPAGTICLDLGASTGGFTDVLLRRGAAKVYAVDVGTGQLHEKIGADPRVINLERTHAKDLGRALVHDPIGLIVCDVSFISLKKALPPALDLAAPGARLIALIKPQFEVGREGIGKGGIVREGLAEPAARDIERWLDRRPGWTTTHLMESPIRGGDGNREFLLGGVKSR